MSSQTLYRDSPNLNIVNSVDPNAPYNTTVPSSPFKGLVVHDTGNQNDTVQGVISYGHRRDPARGFAPGYHFYIDKNGQIYQGAPLDKRTNHVKTDQTDPRNVLARTPFNRDLDNSNSIGIALVGTTGQETPAQIGAAVHLIRSLQASYNISSDKVVSHYELQNDKHPNEGKAVVTAFRTAQATPSATAPAPAAAPSATAPAPAAAPPATAAAPAETPPPATPASSTMPHGRPHHGHHARLRHETGHAHGHHHPHHPHHHHHHHHHHHAHHAP